MRALIAEDEPLVQLVAESAISDLGYDVVAVSHGADALSISQNQKSLDLLFTDINLANAIDGWELAAAVVDDHPDIGVIYTSGGASFTEYQSRGVDGSVWLPKPYTAGELKDAISRLGKSEA
jgi:CheY-like chemotaxis protein